MLCEQLATWESLEFGVAFRSPEHPTLAAANQLRDVWLETVSGDTAYERTEAHFAAHGRICRRWVPSSGQPTEPVASVLKNKGWTRVETLAMGLADWAMASMASPAAIRVLPARAMKKAYRKTFDGATPAEMQAGIERLNDPNYEAFVAVMDGEPAGRSAYLEVGDIARLADVFVRPSFRRRDIGRVMVAHFLRIGRRLSPRVVVASCDATDPASRSFLERCGFMASGSLTAFDRSSD